MLLRNRLTTCLALATLLGLALGAPPASAAPPPDDPEALPGWATEEAGPVCAMLHAEVLPVYAELLETLGRASHPVLPLARDRMHDPGSQYDDDPYWDRYELDPMPEGTCRAFRDDAQRMTWESVVEPAWPETCQTVRGIETCVVVNHYQCDVGLITYHRAIFVCLGGIFPDR